MRLKWRPTARNGFLLSVFVAALAAWSPHADAQMFGERTLGKPLSRQQGPSLVTGAGAENVGAISGREKFIRGNRRADDFVGTDRGDLTQFVGNQQVNNTTTSRPAALEARRRQPVRTQIPLNPPLPGNNGNYVYEPPLVVGFDFTPPDAKAVAADLARSLQSLGATDRSRRQQPSSSEPGHSSRKDSVEVSVEGQTAILRGTVASAAARDLAERIALLEPTISKVRNELTVQPPSPGAPTPSR